MEEFINREIKPISNKSYDYHTRYRISFTTFKNHIIGLDLENCNISYFPENLSHFKFLRNLSLACNNIKKFPESLLNLTNLTSLNLSRNKLEELSNFAPEMCNLEVLNLNQNLINNLPDSIFQLKTLKDLYLAYNKLEILPKSICNLKFLRRLMIDGNNLKSLPTSLFEIDSLKRLYISQAHLDDEAQNLIRITMKNFQEYVQSNNLLEDHTYITQYIHKVPKLYIITPPYNIDFFYEFGGEMLWSRNENASLRFGSPIYPFRLPISSDDAQKLKNLSVVWEKLEFPNLRKKKHEIDYNSQYSEWEQMKRETGEFLLKISQELGPDFQFSNDFKYYIDFRNKMQELESDISNERIKAIINEGISNNDDIILLSILKKKILNQFNEKELLEFLISLKLHGKVRFANILVSEYLNNYSNKKVT